MSWISPTGFVDSGSTWSQETNAYDEDTGTYTDSMIVVAGWSDRLELTHSAITCDKVQMWSSTQANIDLIEIDVDYDSAWHNIYSGTPTVNAYVEYAIGSIESVTAMRVRYHSLKNSRAVRVHEADFWEVVGGVTHYGAATLSGIGTLAGNGVGIFAGLSTLAGIGTVACMGALTAVGKATLSGIGSLVGIGQRIVNGIATLSGTGLLNAIGGVWKLGAATLAGIGSLVTNAVGTFVGSTTLAGIGTLTAQGVRIFVGRVALIGIGNLAARSVITVIGKAVLVGIGKLDVIGVYDRILRILDIATTEDLNITATQKEYLTITSDMDTGLEITSEFKGG